MKSLLAILILMLVYAVALGQSASPAPVVALPFVDQVTKWLTEHMAMAIVGLGFVIELIVRAVPTAKPQSLLLWLSSALASVVKFLQALSAYVDKLLQNTKG